MYPRYNLNGKFGDGVVKGSFHAARDEYEIDLDLVCASKPGVLPPLAGERVVRHGPFPPKTWLRRG